MPALSLRDLAFAAFTVASGIITGLLVSNEPSLAQAALPPLMWILLAMAFYELAVGYVMKLSPGSLVSMPVRLVALLIAAGAYHLVLSRFGTL